LGLKDGRAPFAWGGLDPALRCGHAFLDRCDLRSQSALLCPQVLGPLAVGIVDLGQFVPYCAKLGIEASGVRLQPCPGSLARCSTRPARGRDFGSPRLVEILELAFHELDVAAQRRQFGAEDLSLFARLIAERFQRCLGLAHLVGHLIEQSFEYVASPGNRKLISPGLLEHRHAFGRLDSGRPALSQRHTHGHAHRQHAQNNRPSDTGARIATTFFYDSAYSLLHGFFLSNNGRQKRHLSLR
jgi:hypothetical protein